MDIVQTVGKALNIFNMRAHLKKYFRVDLNKDTGFYKTRKEKTKEYLTGLSEKLIFSAFSATIGGIIGFAIERLLAKG